MLFFWCAEQKKLSAQYKLLPLFGASFAALWPSAKKRAQYKSLLHFLGGEGVCV